MPIFFRQRPAPPVATPSPLRIKVAKLPLQDAATLLSAAAGPDLAAADFADAMLHLAGGGRVNQPAADYGEGDSTLVALNALAKNLGAQGKTHQAEALARQCLTALEGHHGPHHAQTLRARNSLACRLQNQGKFVEARHLYLHTVELQRQVLGAQHLDTIATLENLATLLCEGEEVDSAAPLLHEVVATRRRQLGDAHPDTLRSLNNLAMLRVKQGSLVQAEQLLRQSLLGQRRVLGDAHPETLTTLSNLATVLEDLKHDAQAEKLHREAFAQRQSCLGEAHVDTLTSAINLASYLMQHACFAEALGLLNATLALAAKTFPPHHFFTGNLRARLGACMAALGQYEAAETHLVGGYHTLRAALGGVHARTQRAASALIALYERWGKKQRAASFRSALASCS